MWHSTLKENINMLSGRGSRLVSAARVVPLLQPDHRNVVSVPRASSGRSPDRRPLLQRRHHTVPLFCHPKQRLGRTGQGVVSSLNSQAPWPRTDAGGTGTCSHSRAKCCMRVDVVHEQPWVTWGTLTLSSCLLWCPFTPCRWAMTGGFGG
jgi:hypothetical protein